MNARRLLLYLLLNALVSAATVIAVLWAWDRFVRAPAIPAAPPPQATPLPLPTATPGLAPVTPFPTPLPPTPIAHTVQAGETLGAIAQRYDVSLEDLMAANGLTDPNVLSVGQQLVIPIGGGAPASPDEPPAQPATPVVTVAPLPTATSNPNAPPPRLAIREVRAAGQLESEAVVIANSGGPVDLAGWTLRDEAGRQYTFPALTLFEGGIVTVHTRAGVDTVIDLYWGLAEAVWASGKLMLLTDPNGNLGARFVVP